MLASDAYRGREQTYLKHFFLEKYLERVAYNICSFKDEFDFVDGFAGPWRSGDHELSDTSFRIATEALQRVKSAYLERRARQIRMHAIFVCNSSTGRDRIAQAAREVDDVEVSVIEGEFEESIQDLRARLGDRFSLCFVDPTGWKGFALRRLEPLLRRRDTEVVVNFMFDHVNRFIGLPEQARNFNELFGGEEWRSLLKDPERREERLVDLDRRLLGEVGGFQHAASTRIKKPLVDRTYFYLVYATHHLKGLREFRAVEKAAYVEQERTRAEARQFQELQRSGQASLFAASGDSADANEERAHRLREARAVLLQMTEAEVEVRYADALARLLELPLVWETDVKALVSELEKIGALVVEGLGPEEKVPKAGKPHYLRRRPWPDAKLAPWAGSRGGQGASGPWPSTSVTRERSSLRRMPTDAS